VFLSLVLPFSMRGVEHVLRVFKSGRFATTDADLYPASTTSSIKRTQKAHTNCPLIPSSILHHPRHFSVPSPSCSSQTMKSSPHLRTTYLHDFNLRGVPGAYSPNTLKICLAPLHILSFALLSVNNRNCFEKALSASTRIQIA
jgi:hypothetical protein